MTPLISKFLAHLLLLFWPQYAAVPFTAGGAAEPTFTYVGGAKGSAVSSGTTAAVTYTPTAGNAVVCGVFYYPATLSITSVKDNAGTPNTYTVSAHSPVTASSSTITTALVYLLNVPASPGTVITLTMSGTITYNTGLRCEEFHRSAGAWAVDNDFAGGSASAGTTLNTPTVTASVAGELEYFFGAAQSSADITPILSPWIAGVASDGTTGSNGGYILSGSSGGTAANATIGSSAQWNSIGIAIK